MFYTVFSIILSNLVRDIPVDKALSERYYDFNVVF